MVIRAFTPMECFFGSTLRQWGSAFIVALECVQFKAKHSSMMEDYSILVEFVAMEIESPYFNLQTCKLKHGAYGVER